MLVQEGDTRRRKWPLGHIIQVMPGADNVVQVEDVTRKNSTYTRLVAKLFKLEDNEEDLDFLKEGRMLSGTTSNLA